MKTFFLAAALLFTSVTNKIFATDVPVTPAVLQSFQQNFGNITPVQWSVVNQLYKAVFTIDGQEIAAFFSISDGMFVASGRYLTYEELPHMLRTSLKNFTASYTLVEIFEVETDAGRAYYATVKKGKESLLLEAHTKTWSLFKKN